MPAKRPVDDADDHLVDTANDINLCERLTLDGSLPYWNTQLLFLRNILKAACDGTDAAVCDKACSYWYMEIDGGSRICTSDLAGAQCAEPKAPGHADPAYKDTSTNDIPFCDPPSPPPQPPPSPPPPSPPPPRSA